MIFADTLLNGSGLMRFASDENILNSIFNNNESKLINFDKATSEVWDTFKRAGAQYIISYAARHAKRIYFNG